MLGVGDRAVIDDRHLLAAPVFHMAVDGVLAGVDLAIAEPFVKRGIVVIKRLGRGCDPVDGTRPAPSRNPRDRSSKLCKPLQYPMSLLVSQIVTLRQEVAQNVA